MNDRIKELALKCYKDAYGLNQIEGFSGSLEEFINKFSELIVEECCGILTKHVGTALDHSGYAALPESLILDHFGMNV